ncbi:hypothetical protein MASR2M15_07830 [Anaerolineales bacterium]
MTNNSYQKIKFIPQDEFVIDNLETLKVLADPLRMRAIELMSEPCTVRQVADVMDLVPTKLYYHIGLLEKHGLIQVVDTRLVSGIIEKHYQTVARTITIDKDLLSPSESGGEQRLELTLMSVFEDTKNDFFQSLEAGAFELDAETPQHETLSLGSWQLYLTDDQAKAFYKQLNALFEEYSQASKPQKGLEDVQQYRYFHLVFPSSRKHVEEKD